MFSPNIKLKTAIAKLINKNINRVLFAFHVRFTNFNANIGKLQTSKNDITTLRIITAIQLSKKATKQFPYTDKLINEAINKAFAGTGNPTKLTVCRVSILNFAKRNAEKRAMIKGAKANNSQAKPLSKLPVNLFPKRDCNFTCNNIAGATPKLTKSDKESNCFPKSE